MKTLRILTFVFTGLFIFFVFAKDKIGINPSASMPRGIYWRCDKSLLEKGDIVLACLPDTSDARLFIKRGYLYGEGCRGGHGKILKIIQGIPGDEVLINRLGVSIEGERVPNSLPQLEDSLGRKMPLTTLQGRLKKDEYILMGIHPHSLDSRYLGAIERKQILFVVQPIFLID